MTSGVADINLSDHQLVYVQRKKIKMPTKKLVLQVDRIDIMMSMLLRLILLSSPGNSSMQVMILKFYGI